MKFKFFIIMTALISTSAMSRSFMCLQGTGLNGYELGVSVESNVISHLWTQTFQSECTEMESFINAINIPFNPSAPASPFLRCRNEGIADGLADAISNITLSCVNDCMANGEEAGDFAGAQWCGVHIYAHQRAPALKLCNFTAAQSCKTALRAYVNQKCGGKLLDLEAFSDSACRF